MSKDRKSARGRKASAAGPDMDPWALLLDSMVEKYLKAVYGLLAGNAVMLCGAYNPWREAESPGASEALGRCQTVSCSKFDAPMACRCGAP